MTTFCLYDYCVCVWMFVEKDINLDDLLIMLPLMCPIKVEKEEEMKEDRDIFYCLLENDSFW